MLKRDAVNRSLFPTRSNVPSIKWVSYQIDFDESFFGALDGMLRACGKLDDHLNALIINLFKITSYLDYDSRTKILKVLEAIIDFCHISMMS